MTLKELKKEYQENLKKLLKALKEGRTEDHLKYCKIEGLLDRKFNRKSMQVKLSRKASRVKVTQHLN